MSKWYNKVLSIDNVIEVKDGWTELRLIINNMYDYDFYNEMCNNYTVIRYLYFTNNNKEYVFKHLFLLSVVKTSDDKLSINFHQNNCDKQDQMNIIRYIKLNKLRTKIQ